MEATRRPTSSGCGTDDRWLTPQYGAPDGFVVVNAHGGLACRLDVAAADDVAIEAGVRLISPDRPGIGLSDPHPGRTVLDWARGRRRVARPDRRRPVRRDGLVDGRTVRGGGGPRPAPPGDPGGDQSPGALPLTESGVFDELPAMDRFLTRMSQRAPWLAQQWFRMMGFAPRVAPMLYGRLAARELGPADGAVIRDEGFGTFAQMSREAMRQPAGAVEEYRAWMRPWGFAPEDLDRARRHLGGHATTNWSTQLATSTRVANPECHVEHSRRRTFRRAPALPRDLRRAATLVEAGR